MCEESFVAVKKIFASKECAVASAVRCCQVFSVWSYLRPLEHGLMQRATFHFYCHVKIFGDVGDLAMLVTFACDTCVWRLRDCCRADCIAQ